MNKFKNKFYRTLNLDKDTKKILKDFNYLKEKMMRDIENQHEDEPEGE